METGRYIYVTVKVSVSDINFYISEIQVFVMKVPAPIPGQA